MAKVQIEITTRCNFKCWYCTGRAMEQKDMSLDTFCSIVDAMPDLKLVLLQGEGEPLLWPHMDKAIDYLTTKGIDAITVTNGSIYKPEVLKKCARLYVSLDSVDPKVSKDVGRFNVQKVLNNILRYKKFLKVRVFITDYGQDLKETFAWLNKNGIDYGINKLNKKQDYIKFYPSKTKAAEPVESTKKYTCGYSFVGRAQYFNVDGLPLPCCFTKDLTDFVSVQDTIIKMNKGIVPQTCVGCKFLKPAK